MIGKMFSNLLTKKAVIWAGVGLLSVAAIPAVGATVSHLHRKAALTHRTTTPAKLHAKPTAKAAAKPLHTTSHRATALAAASHNGAASHTGTARHTSSAGARPLAAVTSMHSGHTALSKTAKPAKTTKLTTVTRKTPAKPLSSTRTPKPSALRVASASRSISHLGVLESPTDLRASKRVSIR